MDLEKAYDTIDRHGMWQMLRLYEVGGKLLKAVQSFYVDSRACVRVGNDVSKWIRVNVGLRQGCVMSPLLFNVYMNGVVREVNVRVLGKGLDLLSAIVGRFQINQLLLLLIIKKIIIIIIIKKDWHCKAGRGRLTPYQSEDSSPTLPTYRGKEEKGKIVDDKKRREELGQQKGIGPALETRQSHTIEYGVDLIVPERY